MSNEIERAKSGRAKCRVCGEAIATGELRLAEEAPSESVHFSGTINRYYHLECAVRDRPRVLARALLVTTIEIPDREELEAKVKGAIETFETRSEASEAAVDTADAYRTFADSVATSSPEALAEAALVFGDWLQSVGDPRGDLIVFHHALESAPAERRAELEARAEKVLARNAKTLVPQLADVELSWRSGFVEAVSICSTSALVRERLDGLWRHPSMLVVRAVAVRYESWQSVAVVANLLPLPPSVRSLEIDVVRTPIGPLDGLAGTALTRLSLTGVCDVRGLESTTLATLELHRPVAAEGAPLTEQIRQLDRQRLPALTSLALHMRDRADDAVTALLASGLVAELSSLTLSGGLSGIGAMALASSGARLAHLDIAGNPSLPADVLARLAEIADEVVHQRPGIAEESPRDTDDADNANNTDVWRVRHVRKPEWGVGVVLEESDDRIEIEFENVGRKIIRGLELIEDA